MGSMSESQMVQHIIDILKEKMEKDYAVGETKRDAHPKHLGLLKAYFSVSENLSEELRVGLFKEPKTYSSLIRISSSNPKVQGDDVKDLRGFAIKLLGVQEEKYFDSDEKITQDFVLISNPTIPLGTVKLFHDAIYYSIKKHPLVFVGKMIFTGKAKLLKQLASARKNQTSPLDIRYWSTTPYMFGNEIVKYSIIPRSNYKSVLPKELTKTYLTDNMEKHLNTEEAIFDFMVQFQKDENQMPVEDISVDWKESESPFIKVAEIRIPKQKFRTEQNDEMAELLSFSPSHTLKQHKPIGGIILSTFFPNIKSPPTEHTKSPSSSFSISAFNNILCSEFLSSSSKSKVLYLRKYSLIISKFKSLIDVFLTGDMSK